MTYAIISDIHGNYPALSAVITDALANGAHHFIFLGDYTCTFPFQNEITDTLRSLPHKTAIRGNHEDNLVNIYNSMPNTSVPKIDLPILWSYQQFTPENFAYYFNLPVSAQLANNIFLSHNMELFYHEDNKFFLASYYKQKMEVEPFKHATYLQNATKSLLVRTKAMSDIRALPKGVHLFGHNHLQFYAEIEGCLFINPGSCGFPLDYDARAAYTLLKIIDNNGWKVTERRVEYDMNETIEAMDKSGFSKRFPEWKLIYTQQLQTASDYIGSFVRHVKNTANKLGIENFRDTVVWYEALASYQF